MHRKTTTPYRSNAWKGREAWNGLVDRISDHFPWNKGTYHSCDGARRSYVGTSSKDLARKSAPHTNSHSRSSLRIGLAAAGAVALAVGACAVYTSMPHVQGKKPLAEIVLGQPEIRSETPFMDRLQEAEIDSLNICGVGLDTPTKNLGYLMRDGWKPLFEPLETLRVQEEVAVPLPVLYALAAWEVGIEALAEEGRFGCAAERRITSNTGCRGPFGVSRDLLHDYNEAHPQDTLTWNQMYAYQHNFMVAVDFNLENSYGERRGDLFLMLIDHGSGRGTTNYLLEYFGSKEKLEREFWDTEVPPKINKKHPAQDISPTLINQARDLTQQVAAIAYMEDALMRSNGLDPAEGLSDQRRDAYDRFVGQGMARYLHGKELVSRGKTTGAAEAYLNRLIRPDEFDGRDLSERVQLFTQNTR